MMTSDDFCVYFHFSLFPIPCSEVYLSVRGSQVQWTLKDEVWISVYNVIDLDDDKWLLLMDRLDELQRLIILEWNNESFTQENCRTILDLQNSNSDLPFSLYLAAALSSRNGQQLGLSHK